VCGYLDVAVRDVVLAAGAFALARLTKVRGSSAVLAREHEPLQQAA
jgi:hypothetical protein